MARFAGSVQGVVVQIAMLALPARSPSDDRELYVNSGIVAFLIFDFGFGNAVCAPVLQKTGFFA